MMRLAVIEYRLIHEGAIVIGVDTSHWKGYVGGHFGKALDDERLIAHGQRHAFGPTRGNVGEHQAVHKVPIALGATAMLDHIHLKKTLAAGRANPQKCVRGCCVVSLNPRVASNKNVTRNR